MVEDQALTQRDVEALRDTLDKLDRTIVSLADKIELTYVRKDVHDQQLRALAATVASHSSWLEWAQRIVLALVITGLVGLLLVQRGAA